MSPVISNKIITRTRQLFMKQKNSGKLILTSYQFETPQKERKCTGIACFIVNNRLEYIKVIPDSDTLPAGSIVTGKVKNIVPNIQAAFVALDKDQHMGFLPLADSEHAIVTNRPYQGKLQQGDEVLVQIVREPMKTKEATLSTKLKLSGRYIVAQTGSGRLLFSKKLSAKMKETLVNFLVSKAIITRDKQLIGVDDIDVTVRTEAGSLCVHKALDVSGNTAEDADYMLTHGTIFIKELEEITSGLRRMINQASMRTCYSVHVKPISWLEEVWNELSACGFEIEEYVSDDIQIINTLKEYVPDEYADNIRYYQDEKVSLQALYGLNAKVDELRQKKVWLPSGGYLCIEPTEAMIVVDVNSGKAIHKEKSSEALYAEINKEAALELTRQLRLRNLSGMVLVDFINMKDKTKEQEILKLVKKCSERDFSKITVYEFTKLGLLELTRNKKSKGLHECLS